MFKLVREGISAADAINSQHVWPVKYTATNSDDDSPAKIFVIQKSGNDIAGDTFSCVASATQMTDLPVDAPNEGGPFYRSDVAELGFRSPEAADEAIEAVEAAVQDLANNLEAASNLSVLDTVTIAPTNG